VDAERMRANIAATRGAVFSERAMMLLGARLGRDAAHELVGEAARKSAIESRPLTEVLSENPEVTSIIDTKTLRDLDAPEGYLGIAEQFRERLLGSDSGGKPAGKK
jgi:adenylosuccinate lyase